MAALEQQPQQLNEAFETERIRASLFEDEHGIKAYFDKYLHANFDNVETRDEILEYFVDTLYVYNDRIVITSWCFEDNREILFDL